MTTLKAYLWLGLLLALTPALLAAAETEWLVAPYAWLPDISMDQSADGSSGGGSISGSDLLDKIDAAGMIRVEAARNRWGFTLDYIFLAVSDESVATLPPPTPVDVDVRADVDVDVLELGGFYRPSGNDSGIDYLFGFRRISVDKTLLLTPVIGGPTQRFDGDSDFTDVFIGTRFLHRFNENWDLTMRVDLGFGDSEGTLNFLTSVGYRFPGPFTLQLGFRHVDMKFKDDVNGAVETTDLELSGPFLGFVFRF
jgi:hypothetical protein